MCHVCPSFRHMKWMGKRKQSFVFIVAVNEKFVNETVFGGGGRHRAGILAKFIELHVRTSRQGGANVRFQLL
ncbi:hypothetical protein PspKH34_37440 [Parageobacillus sp. KH3-4]|nr:hypothetical protein PspKH34_37440 [Parageobacillus sp. KH3-4]